MFTNLQFFPEAASAQAGQVDAVFFFMVAVTAFFSVLIATLVVVFAVKYHRKHDDEVGVAIHGSLALELLWTDHPVRHRDGDVRVGRQGFLRSFTAPGERDRNLRRRQAVDVEGPAHGRDARDQRAARSRRAAGEVDHGVRGCHPQLLHSGISREGGRHSWAATTRCGSRRRSRAHTICSAPSIAGPSTQE